MPDTKQFFDEYAYDFDALYGVPNNFINLIANPIFRKSMRLRFEKTIAYADPVVGKTVIDIGCGPGHYAIALAKAGAKKIVGIDFAPEMINIAKQKAANANVSNQCEFMVADIFNFQQVEKYNYSILMGFMDYIADPVKLITKVVSLTENKIFFSFPKDGGFLAFQRKLRYQKRCPLFMYKKNDLIDIFSKFKPFEYKIEGIHRDFFVTLTIKK